MALGMKIALDTRKRDEDWVVAQIVAYAGILKSPPVEVLEARARSQCTAGERPWD